MLTCITRNFTIFIDFLFLYLSLLAESYNTML